MAEATMEASVEVGDLIKAASKGDLDDPQMIAAPTRQHRACLLQSQLKHALGECFA